MSEIFEKTIKTKETKNFIQKTVQLKKKTNTDIKLNEIKLFLQTFDKHNEKHHLRYYVVGLNEYGVKTIRSADGNYYDDDEDYFNARKYDMNKFNSYKHIELIIFQNK